MNNTSHWENVYTTKPHDQVSWYREHLENSIRMILATGIEKDAAIIDVGGGTSTLVDDLLDYGFIDLTVLDISKTAIESSKARLGGRSEQVDWVVADITKADLSPARYDVWHDRAVFHFLTDPEDRRRYLDLVNRSVKKGGHVIVASFGPEGPAKCSGLDVVRYSPDSMHAEFGASYELINSFDETHQTPFGTTQEFIYCYCRKLT